MAESRRWWFVTVSLGLALLLTLPGCDADHSRVLLTRASPVPTPSTVRVPATATPTTASALAPTATPAAQQPSPSAVPTRSSTPSPLPTTTPLPGLAVTPIQVLPTATSARIPTVAPVPPAAPTPTPLRVHIVRFGDTLATIAYQYGTTATAIARLNGLANANRIYPGQRLLIP